VERRKYPRHRYIEEIAICGEDKTEHSAMSFETSEGGMSAATPNYFTVGDQVELYSILGDWVKATASSTPQTQTHTSPQLSFSRAEREDPGVVREAAAVSKHGGYLGEISDISD
jgi:hypothetical protein